MVTVSPKRELAFLRDECLRQQEAIAALRAENARLAAENEALNALVEGLTQKCNALLYPGPTDVAGHLRAAAASQAVDTARAHLQEVRNAKA